MRKGKKLINDENPIEKLVAAGIIIAIIAAIILCIYFWTNMPV